MSCRKDFKPGTPVKILTELGTVFIGKVLGEAEIGAEKRDVKVEEEELFLVVKLTACTAPFKEGEIVFFNIDHIVAITVLCECHKED
jgi:hypothetical protein